jgi:DNA-binding NarL/FixJ family response regulator
MRTAVIRLVIADDHDVVRHGLALMFAATDDIVVVGEAASGGEVLHIVRERHPDVILLDLRMPGLEGIEALKRLKRLQQPPRVLVLTGVDDRHDVLEAVSAGADGYALKQISPAQLQEAVRAVAAGQSYLHPGITGQVLAAARRKTGMRSSDPWGLSRRELEVLELMGRSLTTDEIASRLFIGEETVRTHVKSILKKMGKRHRMDAVLAAAAAGVIDLSEPAAFR